MKRIIVYIMAVAGLVFSANAQETRKIKDKKHHHEKGMMMKELNLTAAQKEQMKAMRLDAKTQMAELDKMENLSVKEYKTRKLAIHKAQKEKMNNLLTLEQKNQVTKNKTENAARHEIKKAEKMEKVRIRLNLSDEQVTQMQANRNAQQARVKAIRENEKLSQAEKKEKLMALKQENKESYKRILTPEQVIKMEEHKKMGHKKRKMEKDPSK